MIKVTGNSKYLNFKYAQFMCTQILRYNHMLALRTSAMPFEKAVLK